MKLRIKDFMTTDVIKLLWDDSILKATNIMVKYQIDGMPVVDNEGKLIGLFTKTHALKAIGMDSQIAVGVLMKTDVITISEEAIPEDALKARARVETQISSCATRHSLSL